MQGDYYLVAPALADLPHVERTLEGAIRTALGRVWRFGAEGTPTELEWCSSALARRAYLFGRRQAVAQARRYPRPDWSPGVNPRPDTAENERRFAEEE